MTDKIHKSLYALEIPVFSNSKPDFQRQQGYDILSLKFNAQDTAEIPEAKNILKSLLPRITAPLMINGANNDNIDRELLPELMSVLDRECIISPANENTYKDIVPAVIKGGHRLVLKSPIDINLCKELNILASDMGLPLDKIIIDTDIGGLGYGFEYGYSIMEKIKLEDDEYLNMPLISFADFFKKLGRFKKTRKNV